jgi:hypothetical protein
LSHPFQLPRTPTTQRLTTTTLGLLRSCYAEQEPNTVKDNNLPFYYRSGCCGERDTVGHC